MKGIIIFGATGSIGTQTLDIIRKNDEYQLLAFTFFKNIEKAKKIIQEFHPVVVGISDSRFKELLTDEVEILNGNNPKEIIEYPYHLSEILYVNAVSGAAGLKPTYEIINHNHDVLLANKESLVMAGEIIMELAEEKKVQVIPIDSEHSGLLKIVNKLPANEIENLIITASGGALRDIPLSELKNVTYQTALNHPNWQMGKDITINCATMMNKGYEVIEACHLFHQSLEKVKVLIHRESVVHAMVEFCDGSIEANLGTSDMHIPIQFALNFPKQVYYPSERLHLDKIKELHFDSIDDKRYPCFNLAIEAFKKGGYYPTILNAANEQSVKLFLNEKIKYLEIYEIVKNLLNLHDSFIVTKEKVTIENILILDQKVKEKINQMINERM